jgi:LuxR family maltose regulon positive regulatory protein
MQHYTRGKPSTDWRQPVLAKFCPPRLVSAIERDGLLDLVDRIRARAPVVWISAPAGAGKTTLTLAYLKSRKLKHIWYQLDERDADPATFFYFLREAAARIAPRARAVLPLLKPEYALGLNAYAQNFVLQLGTLFRAPVVLVFDNYQKLPDDSPVQALLAEGLGVLPTRLSALMLSHNDPPAAFSGLAVQRHQAVIEEAQLVFSQAEIQTLAKLHGFSQLTPLAIANLRERVRGWAAGTVLMLEQAARRGEPSPRFDEPVERTLLDYFTLRVLQNVPTDARMVLLKTALLSQVTLNAALFLSGEKEAERIFADFARRHYFVYRLSGTEPVYQYHPLFREFLLARLKQTLTPEELANLRRHAASSAEAAGDFDNAVSLWREAGAWDELARYLHGAAQGLLEQGRGRALAAWIGDIPPETLEQDPWLLFWLGQCCLSFDFSDARAHLEKALGLFHSRADRAGTLLILAAIVDTIIHEFIDLARLDPWVEWLKRELATEPGFPAPNIGFRVESSMAVALMFRCHRREEINPWIERARVILPHIPDISGRCRLAVYLALHATWSGDLNGLVALVLDVRRWSQSAQSRVQNGIEMQYAAYVQTLHEWIAGVQDYGYAAAVAALAMAETSGIRVIEHHLVARAVFGALCKGDLVAARNHLDRIRFLASDLTIPRLHLFQYHYLPGWYFLLAGNFPEALREAESSLRISQVSGASAFHQAFSRIVAAHALFEMERQDEARIYIVAILAFARDFGSPVVEFDGLLLQARMDLEGGDTSRAEHGLEVLRQALALGRAYGYLNTVVWYPTAVASLCCHALEHHVEEWYVQNLIAKRGLIPALTPHYLENWPWPLRIYTLGRFAIVKDGKPVEFEAKAQKKTLALVKALIALGGREVSEQRLCDELWPDAEADDARRNFKVTLHRLRKIIGHDALRLQESKLWLNERVCWVDTWSLERRLSRFHSIVGAMPVAEHIKVGEQVIEHYQGPFLQDEDAAYAIAPRERLRSKAIRVIATLAERLQREAMHDQAFTWYEKGIEIEPLTESFYQGLMRICHILQRPAEGLAVYERCRKVLGAQLHIFPSPDTEALAQSLRNQAG